MWCETNVKLSQPNLFRCLSFLIWCCRVSSQIKAPTKCDPGQMVHNHYIKRNSELVQKYVFGGRVGFAISQIWYRRWAWNTSGDNKSCRSIYFEKYWVIFKSNDNSKTNFIDLLWFWLSLLRIMSSWNYSINICLTLFFLLNVS